MVAGSLRELSEAPTRSIVPDKLREEPWGIPFLPHRELAPEKIVLVSELVGLVDHPMDQTPRVVIVVLDGAVADLALFRMSLR